MLIFLALTKYFFGDKIRLQVIELMKTITKNCTGGITHENT